MSVAELERACIEAWPARHAHEIDGWRTFATDGKSWRVNATWPLAWNGADAEAALRTAETWAAAHNVAPAFKLADGAIHPANLATLRSILSARPPRASFLDVPIGLRDPYALATLSIVVTCTPGTIWVEFDDTTGVLTLHVLDLDDPARMVAFIQRRYEAPIREIFE